MTDETDSATHEVKSKVNVDPQILERQRHTNRHAGWNRLGAKWNGMTEVILLGGGPSLNTTQDELDHLMTRQLPLVTVNGSYRWALDHPMFVSLQIVMDAREHNARFTHPVLPGSRYLVADTCHPAVLKGLPKKNTHLWMRESVPGGSTVMLNAIPLLKWMGAEMIHIFGFDSCFLDDQHHAYPQTENDVDEHIKVDVDGRLFHTTPWMVMQAEEFIELSPHWGDLRVYGDGMIAHIIQCSKD